MEGNDDCRQREAVILRTRSSGRRCNAPLVGPMRSCRWPSPDSLIARFA